MLEGLLGVGNLDHPAFAKLVMKLGLELGRFKQPSYDDEDFLIEDTDGKTYLSGFYGRFMKLPRKERIPFLREWLVISLPDVDLPPAWEEARASLMPVVHAPGYLSYANLRTQNKGLGIGDVSALALAPDLYETLVVDQPMNMLDVTDYHLRAWNVSFADAVAIARTNLRDKLAARTQIAAVAPEIWRVDRAGCGDVYAAARILVPELLQRTASELLVAVPNRDTLLLANAAAPGTFDALVSMLEAASQPPHPHAITSRIYQLVGGALRPFEPAAHSPMSGTYQALLASDVTRRAGIEQEMRSQRRAL
jgi:hypothetical protein